MRPQADPPAERVSNQDRPASPRGELYLCTWLYAEQEGDESTYPQVRGKSSSASFQATYWRCVALFFATSVRLQPERKHLLFTNVEQLPRVSGTDMGELLGRLGVEVVQLPLTHLTPRGHFHAWRNQFYVFDVACYLEGRVRPDDAIALLDSDCVWIEHADSMHTALERDGALTYVITLPVDWPESRLTRDELRAVSNEFAGGGVGYALSYCGGELLAATGRELTRLRAEIAKTWSTFLARYDGGHSVFNDEAQMLSHMYEQLGYPLGNGDPFIRRIWTGSLGGFNTASPYDLGLAIWHLPLEKRFGIRRLFPAVVDPDSQFWSVDPGPDWRAYLGELLGVPQNTRKKTLKDLGRKVADRLPPS